MNAPVETRLSLGVSTIFVALAFTACIGSWSLAADVAEARDGTVRVDGRGTTINESVTVRLTDVDRDINNRPYQTRTGETRLSGSSLERVLRKAAADAGGWLDLGEVPYFEVTLPGAEVVNLSRGEALTQSGFPDGPPILWQDGSDTVLFLPGRANGSAGSYHRYRTSAVPIRIGKGEVYDITLSPESIEVDVGDRVTFNARVSNPVAGEKLSFRWTVNGTLEATGSASRFSKTFRREGRYSVVVTVSGKRESSSAAALVTVGSPPAPPQPKKQPESSTTAPQAFIPTPGGVGGGGGTSGGVPGGGGGSGIGGTLDIPAPDQAGDSGSDSELPLVSGEVLGPDVEITELQPGDQAEAGPAEDSADESSGFGLPGEAWTLFGVGLLVGLGGLIEFRLFSRVG